MKIYNIYIYNYLYFYSYTSGSIVKAAEHVLTNRRIKMLVKQPIKVENFLNVLSGFTERNDKEVLKFRQFTEDVTGMTLLMQEKKRKEEEAKKEDEGDKNKKGKKK